MLTIFQALRFTSFDLNLLLVRGHQEDRGNHSEAPYPRKLKRGRIRVEPRSRIQGVVKTRSLLSRSRWRPVKSQLSALYFTPKTFLKFRSI